MIRQRSEQAANRFENIPPLFQCFIAGFLTVWCCGWFGMSGFAIITTIQVYQETSALKATKWEVQNCSVVERGMRAEKYLTWTPPYYDLWGANHDHCDATSVPSAGRLLEDRDDTETDAIVNVSEPVILRRLSSYRFDSGRRRRPDLYLPWFKVQPVTDNTVKCAYPWGTTANFGRLPFYSARDLYLDHPVGSLSECFSDLENQQAPMAMWPVSELPDANLWFLLIAIPFFFIPCCCCVPCLWCGACVMCWSSMLCPSDADGSSEETEPEEELLQ